MATPAPAQPLKRAQAPALRWPITICILALLPCLVSTCGLLRRPRTAPVIAYHEAAGIHYIEVVPVGPELDEALPMVVLIHGLGDTPRAAWIGPDAAPARYLLPQAPSAFGAGYSWFPYRINEQNPELDQHVSAAADQLAQFIRIAQLRHLTAGLPIVAGFSQGGILSMALALAHPEQIALAQPVAGYLPESLWPTTPNPKHNPPIRASHGTDDRIIAIAPTIAMVETLRRRGFDITLQRFVGVGHTQSPQMKDMMNQVIGEAIRQVMR